MGYESPVVGRIADAGKLIRHSQVAGMGSSLTYYAMNSECERLGQEVGCGTWTAQIIHDLGPWQFAAT
jgi:hypothetical protein